MVLKFGSFSNLSDRFFELGFDTPIIVLISVYASIANLPPTQRTDRKSENSNQLAPTNLSDNIKSVYYFLSFLTSHNNVV